MSYIDTYAYDERAAKIDIHNGTTANDNYLAQLEELLKNAIELTEVAYSKTSALWITASILQRLASVVNYYDRTMTKAKEVSESPTATENQLLYWYERLDSLKTEQAIKSLFQEYGEKYEKQVILYTSDNLDSLRVNLPTLDEILKRNAEPRKTANATKTNQAREALKFMLKS